MEKKSIRALSICVVLLVAGLGACILKIGNLEKEIDDLERHLSSEVSSVRSGMNALSSNVEAQMKKQASILTSATWGYGAIDPDDLTAPLSMSIVPKALTDETRVNVSVAGSSIELEREGDVFSGSIAVPVAFRGDGRPVVAVIEGETRTIEVVEEVDTALLYEEYLPHLYAEDTSGRVETKDGSIVFDTDLFIFYDRMKEQAATFEKAEVVVSVNGSQIDRIDATDYITDVSHGGGDWIYLPFNKSYPVPDGGELVVTVIAVDSFGFTHAVETGAYVRHGDELTWHVRSGGEEIWAAPGEYVYTN